MDISSISKEQKSAAAVAWLSENADSAPEFVRKTIDKLIAVNNEGMAFVREIQELKKKEQQLDTAIGEKIGGAKVLFEMIASDLTDDEIDEFASKYEPSAPATQKESTPDISMAGETASKIEASK